MAEESTIERILGEIKQELIDELSSLRSKTQNQKDFLKFLLNVDDYYYKQGLCPTSQKQFDFSASTADITVFGG